MVINVLYVDLHLGLIYYCTLYITYNNCMSSWDERWNVYLSYITDTYTLVPDSVTYYNLLINEG